MNQVNEAIKTEEQVLASNQTLNGDVSAVVNSVSSPTMQDLLNKVSGNPTLKIGDTIKGTVIFLAKNEAILDIPNLGIGIVRGKELYNEEYLASLKIGNEVEALVVDLDNELDMLELSFRAIGRDKIWSEIQAMYEAGGVVEAKVRDANRGGFLVKVKGVDGFLPASLLSPNHAIKTGVGEDKSVSNQMKKYIGQSFQVKIISVNPEADNIIVSEKAVSDEEMQIKIQKYKVGTIVEGNVVGAVDFGVFVRFDEDLEGLVHISEIAWKKIEDPKLEFKVGQKVKAKIIDIDKDNRINLSIKQLHPNPWLEFVKKQNIGDVFEGRVSKIVSYGAIVVNDDDIQGLCHISQITDAQLDNPADIHKFLKIDEKKKFTILSIDNGEKLYLTLLPLEKAQKIQESLQMKEEEKTENSQN
jgi:ribosomal protein S1